jgi:hypothetical protein
MAVEANNQNMMTHKNMSGTHGKWVAEGEAASAKMQQNCITEEKN